MSSEQLADGVNPLDAELAATWDVLKGYSGRDTDLGIARRFGGAAAAYSLRDIGAMNRRVVRVRRDSDNTEEDFSAAQVSSGALETFTRAVAPNFSGNALNFDGSSTYVSVTQFTLSGDFTFSFDIFVDFNNSGGGRIAGRTTAAGWIGNLSEGSLTVRADGQSGKTISFDSTLSSGEHSFVLTRSSGTISLSIDSVTQADTVSETNNFTINFIGRQAGNYFKGSIRNIDFGSASYNGYGNTDADWEDQTGSNDGTVNGTADTFFGSDGSVATWYDQSGNGNDVDQTTAGSQPKIIDNGSQVKIDGIPSIKFDGTDDFLERANYTQGDLSQPSTGFAVAKLRVFVDDNQKIFDGHTNTKRNMIQLNQSGSGQFAAFAGSVQTTGEDADADQHLFESRFNAAASRFIIDGEIKSTNSQGSQDMQGINIGANHDSASNFWDGDIQEIIIYNSDLFDDRADLENDINNYYTIY